MKLKLNQIILFTSIVIIITWNVMRVRQVENLEGKKSQAIIYVESKERPIPFIVYNLAKKQTTNTGKLQQILLLANEQKKDELLEVLRTL